ncbi:MAG: FlgD immunoglobulin-like domain containing protein [bacterium]
MRQGAITYDWLANEHYSNGQPVLSEAEKQELAQRFISFADQLKSQAQAPSLFIARDLAPCEYVLVGMALYEPSRAGDPSYAGINAKAREYLDDFDSVWIGKILPAWNAQGGDGGWHGGAIGTGGERDLVRPNRHSWDTTLWAFAPTLFAHYTATGLPIEESVFNSPVIKNSVEWQLHMLQPIDTPSEREGWYIEVGAVSNLRDKWSFPMRMYSRRRFSTDPEQQKVAELGGWIRQSIHSKTTNGGSWDMIDQLIFEDKWPNFRTPEEIGYPTTRHFEKLGWVFMRTGFTSADDLVSLFIAQPYRWSELDEGHAQGTFYVERKGKLIEGFNNTIMIDNQGQRSITSFPTLDQGVEAYAPGSIYDVGPGIERFESGTKYDNIYADVTNAYDPNKLQKFTRQIVYLKRDKFIMLDRVITKSPNYKKSWIIDPGATPELAGDKVFVIKNDGTGALWIKRLLPENVTIESQTSDRFEVVPTQPANEDIFLHVFQAVDSDLSKNSPSVVADEAELLTNGDQIGARIGEWEVWFMESDSINVFKNGNPVSVESRGSSPKEFKLNQNYPNPFNPGTQIAYEILTQSFVTIKIYNLLGNEVATLVHEEKVPGSYEVTWNGRNSKGEGVASGIYLYKLVIAGKNSEHFSETKKMILMQ